MRNDLNLIGNVLRKNSFTFANTEAVKISATYVYNEKPEELNAFLNSYNTSKLKSKGVNLDVFDSEVLSVINDIEIGLSNSKGFDDFIQFLEIKFDDVFLSNIERENKEQLLKYIISYKVAMQFIQDNYDILKVNQNLYGLKSDEEGGWWENWGRCAAGVLGGAGAGGLTFGLAGAAIGTIAVPGLGTVSAGLVGAIGGAISGGLTGAAASC